MLLTSNKLDFPDDESLLEYNHFSPFSFENIEFFGKTSPNFGDDQNEKDFQYKYDYPLSIEILSQDKYNIIRDNSIDRITTSTTPLFKIKNTSKKQNPMGRKRLREDINTNESNNDNNFNDYTEKSHDKKAEDNIMRKIKTKLSDVLIEKLNDSLRNKNDKFCKLDKKMGEYLKKDYNEQLMQRTIMDIISNTPINNKYAKEKYINKTLIDKILEENKETNTINILNKKYIDIINEIRYDEENLYDFIQRIEYKEKGIKQKVNINVEEYMELVKNLIKRYDQWFFDKFGRKSKKKNKNPDNFHIII